MTIDASCTVPIPGVVRLADVRAVFGKRLRSLRSITVVVLPPAGGDMIIATIAIGGKRSGYGAHDGLVCSACRRVVGTLYAGAVAELACARCRRVRSRHQVAVHTTAWKRYGEREADELIRLLKRQGDGVAFVKAQDLFRRLTRIDTANVHVATELVQAALEGGRGSR